MTGAARGIGRAIALELARAGYEVIGQVREREHGLETLAALAEVSVAGATPSLLAADLIGLAPEDCPGDFDVLVHNAAAYAPYANVEQVTPELEAEVLGVCLAAGLTLARRVLPHMRARGRGRLVFVGSAAGRLGAPGQTAYAAAKAGLAGLTRSLAVEAGRAGITCNLVEPGLVDTERIRGVLPEAGRAAIVDASALGRIGEPEEVAALVGFLASDRAAFLTGAVIPIDGGLGLGVAPRGSAGEEQPPC